LFLFRGSGSFGSAMRPGLAGSAGGGSRFGGRRFRRRLWFGGGGTRLLKRGLLRSLVRRSGSRLRLIRGVRLRRGRVGVRLRVTGLLQRRLLRLLLLWILLRRLRRILLLRARTARRYQRG